MFQAPNPEQSQRAVSVPYVPGFQPCCAVPVVGDELRHAVVSGDDGGAVRSGEGPGEGEVLQVPGASAGDGDVLIFS